MTIGETPVTRTCFALLVAVALVPLACLSSSQRAHDTAAGTLLARIDTARMAWLNSNGDSPAGLAATEHGGRSVQTFARFCHRLLRGSLTSSA
jgi:hypothetical protein